MDKAGLVQKIKEKNQAHRKEQLVKYKHDYDIHVATYDLTGICVREGSVLNIDHIAIKTARRLELANAIDSDLNHSLKIPDTYEEWVCNIGSLDRTKQLFLMEHEDPERQRCAAKSIMDLRANLNPMPSRETYAVNVASFIVSKLPTRSPEVTLADIVIARAILIRSTDLRWTRTYKGAYRPLGAAPYQ